MYGQWRVVRTDDLFKKYFVRVVQLFWWNMFVFMTSLWLAFYLNRPISYQTSVIFKKLNCTTTHFNLKEERKKSVERNLFHCINGWNFFHSFPSSSLATTLSSMCFSCVWKRSLKKHWPRNTRVKEGELEITEGVKDMTEIGLKCRRNNMKIFILSKRIPNSP